MKDMILRTGIYYSPKYDKVCELSSFSMNFENALLVFGFDADLEFWLNSYMAFFFFKHNKYEYIGEVE